MGAEWEPDSEEEAGEAESEEGCLEARAQVRHDAFCLRLTKDDERCGPEMGGGRCPITRSNHIIMMIKHGFIQCQSHH